MNLVENSVWNLDINGKPALNALGELEQKLQETKKAQGELQRGTKEWAESQKDIKALDAEIKQVRETMGQAGMTVKQLEGYARELGKEIKNLTPGTDDYIRKTEELKEVNTRLASVRKDVRAVADEANESKSVWSNMKDWIKSAFTMAVVYEAGRMIVQFVGDAVENFKKFDSASKELSANTNIIGKDLEYLKTQAKELGPQMGKTGEEMLAAYQAMGSAKSDLTENAAALAAVTKEAIILSQAGKIELAPATELMAGALNQFNAPADQAGRFINAIAAGAQVGSAEIVDMTGALKASGTVANAANVSFEQTNGALQSLSTINIKGEQAGTMFRNMLIKLMSSTQDLNPQVVGLDKALDNLAKQNLTTAELAKKFGTENVVAAQHLMTHRDQVKDFTTALTGTDAAYKMAATNNDTLEFKQKQSEASTANLGVALGEKLSPFIIKAYDAFGVFQRVMGDVIQSSTPLFDSFMLLWDAVAGLFGSVGKIITLMFGLDEKSMTTQTVMRGLGMVFSSVAAVAAGLILVIQTIIDGMLFLSGKITFEQLQTNATNTFNSIKAGLKSTFVDQFAVIEPGALAAQKDLSRKQGDARSAEEKKTIDAIVGNEGVTHGKGISEQAAASQKAREDKLAREKKAAEQEAADRTKATETANKAIEKMAIDAITDETARKKAQLAYELSEKLAANAKSKADDLTKVTYEIALREKFKTETEKLETAAREKKLAEDKKKLDETSKLEEQLRTERLTREYATTKSILEYQLTNEKLTITQRQKLKLDLIELERENELRRIDETATKERAKSIETSNQLMKLAGDDDTRKREILNNLDTTTRGIDAKLLADKDAANAKYNAQAKASTEEVLKHALDNETLNIAQRRQLKLDLIELERQNELRRIEETAARERAAATETSNRLMQLAGDDDAKKRQIAAELDATIRGIDARLISDKNAANDSYQARTKAVEKQTLDERKANQDSFFDALKALMTGDMTTFMDFLNKKLASEKALNNDRLQSWTTKGQEIVNVVKGGLEVMTAANELYLTTQINRNNRERDDKIKKLQQQYEKGLIDKETYEGGIKNINEQADAKEKELKMRAWKRDQAGQIAMAVINAAAAALKSLATMGFPLGLVGVAGAAGIAAIQIANIKRQQPPTFAQGGYLRNGGVPQGSRHGSQYGQSGIALVDRATGEEKGEMEGGEPIMILSRNTYKNNGRVIDKLLNSSLHRNGAPVFAEKGSVFGGDGGSYQDYLEPIQSGRMYLFGSKKKYDAKMQAQYDADMKAKADMESYQNMDYGSYDTGSYDSGGSGGFDSGVDFGGGGFDDSGYNGNEYSDVGEAGPIVSSTNNEIAKSQSLMLAIVKNTQITAEAIKMLADITSSMSGKIDGLVGATNQVANASNRAADAGYQAAAASNRAADAAAMGKQHDA